MQDKYSLLGAESEGAGSYVQPLRAAMARGNKTLEQSILEKVWWLGKLPEGSDLYFKAKG